MLSDFWPEKRSTAGAECKGEMLPLDLLLAPCSLLPCLLLDASLLHLLMPSYRNLLKWNASLIINFLLDLLAWVILFDISRRKKRTQPKPKYKVAWDTTLANCNKIIFLFQCFLLPLREMARSTYSLFMLSQELKSILRCSRSGLKFHLNNIQSLD